MQNKNLVVALLQTLILDINTWALAVTPTFNIKA